MDKGLIEIKSLEAELKFLNEKKESNELDIDLKDSSNLLLNETICRLEREIYKLSEDKQKYEDSPKKLKKLKRKGILQTVFCTVAIMTMFLGTSISIYSGIFTVISFGVIGSILSVISGVISFEGYKKLKKFVESTSLSIIDNEIKTKKEEKISVEQEYYLNEEKIEKMSQELDEIEVLIPKIEDKKDKINFIRNLVIEEFCKNNPELDKRIDIAYDHHKSMEEQLQNNNEKQKVNTRKSSSNN